MSNLPATKKDIQTRVNSPEFAQELQRCIAKHMTPARFQRIVCTQIQQTPKLAQCDPASFFSALLKCAQLGLEPDGRTAYLIPYGNTCQLIVGYQGKIELAMRSGVLKSINAYAVRKGDVFRWVNGDIHHEVDWADQTPDREVIAVYAVAKLRDDAYICEVMSRAETEAIRKRSKAGNSGPWVTDRVEMDKKTVIHRVLKKVPMSSEYRDALDHDDDRLEVPVTQPLRATVDLEPALAIEEGLPQDVKTVRDWLMNEALQLSDLLRTEACGKLTALGVQAVKTWGDFPAPIAAELVQMGEVGLVGVVKGGAK